MQAIYGANRGRMWNSGKLERASGGRWAFYPRGKNLRRWRAYEWAVIDVAKLVRASIPPFIPDFLSSRLPLPHRPSFAPSLPGEVTAWALLVAHMVVNWGAAGRSVTGCRWEHERSPACLLTNLRKMGL